MTPTRASAAVVTAIGVALCTVPAAAGVVYTQPFTGTSVTGFTAGQAGIVQPQVPCLTAATSSAPGSIQACAAGEPGGTSGTLPDASGQGALRLNSNGDSEATFVLYGTPFSTAQGVLVTFDEYAYMNDGSGNVGAGIVLAIVDGAASPTVPGGQGGSQGYAQQGSTTPAQAGMAGAWAGVGVDESSYWSSPVEGKTGGPGFVSNTIAIRGAASTSWAYLVGYQVAGAPASLPQPLAFGAATTRGGATPRRYQVIVSKTGVTTVDVDFTGTGTSFQSVIPSTALAGISGQPAVPGTVKLGVTAGTGPDTVHEIQNFSVETGLPDLQLSQSRGGPVAAGTTLQYTLTGQNPAGNGPTSRPIVVVDTLPAGV
ncbi:MAG: conserved repeat protein, partial [Candidatus Eremiobacteraeota bacterium]|nr:conserved repeat protein [Candidatus Eremiobacteraeota bacterium]